MIAAAITFTFVGPEGSDARAQAAAQTTPTTEISAPLTDETVPTFESKEVVQQLPEAEAPSPAISEPRARSLRGLVSELAGDDELSPELRCLAGAVYFEARGEPLEGQLAVAEVIINRSQDGRFPASYCGVVYQRSQFSFVRNGRMPRIATGSAAWNNAVAIAQIAHRNLFQSKADDALFFHARYASPSWRHQKTALATIDTHVFYR